MCHHVNRSLGQRALCALFALFLALAGLPALTAQADEETPAPYVEGEDELPSQEDPGLEEPVYPEEPDTSTGGETQDPSYDPTLPSETEEPSYDDPSSQEPTWDPSYEDPTPPPAYEEEPSYQEPSYEEPSYTHPEEDPWSSSSQDEEETSSHSSRLDAILSATPRPDVTPRPYSPKPSSTPKAGGMAVDRPKITPNPGGATQSPETQEPDYRTFAQLDQRANSMSITLFYGGFACVVLGAVGLLTLLILFLRGRARRDRRDQLMAEIELAESRTQELSPQNSRPQAPVPPAAQPPRVPGPDAVVPQQASLYTEEFTLPPQEDTPKPPVRQSAPVRRPAPQEELPPAQESAEAPLPQEPAAPVSRSKEYDTEEILREALGLLDQNNDDQ